MDIHLHLTTIGINIKRLRGQMKQQDLAKKAGVSRSTLSNIENGKSVELDNLLKIAEALNVHPTDLFLTDKDRQEISYRTKLIVEGAFKAIYPEKK